MSSIPHSASHTSHSPKVGVWLIGAKGGISTVLAVGLAANTSALKFTKTFFAPSGHNTLSNWLAFIQTPGRLHL